jgi:hypothetical protein
LIRSIKVQNILVSWARLTLRLLYRLGPHFSRQIHRSRLQVKRSPNSALNLEEFLNNPPLNINPIS